ncbi:PfkB family carbohydrate kinase [Massilia jejuensis]|uniref:PfkB family carbohydrate kinase n=1 Tax=Massilia jejuensis TaxID=648894 RepID=A0ABW0PLA2_9BURK
MTGANEPVAVFGEALVDDFGTSQVVGGAPFNVARHLAAFGAAPLMLTRIGSDAGGVLVREQLARFGMRSQGVQVDPARPTGRVLVERDGAGHRFVILPDQAWDHIESAPLLHALAGETPALLYAGTLARRAPDSRAALAALLAASAAPRFLDLNLRASQVGDACVLAALHEADIAKLNEEELAWLHDAAGQPRPPGEDACGDAAAAACAALMARFGLRELVVTLGARGALWFGADGARLQARAGAPACLADTVGAGDAFSAVFVLGVVRGWPRAATLARAAAFASAICGVHGAVPPDPSFYAPWRAQWRAGPT